MPIESEAQCKKIEEAFRKTIESLRESVTRVLLHRLEKNYNVRIGCASCSFPEEIEMALAAILGSEAASVLADRMRLHY